MTSEMQDYFPPDPPPPPDEPAGVSYSPWSYDPQWGPPSWSPAPQRTRGSGFRRTALAAFAIACVGAGGGTAWALTTASISNPSNPSGSSNNIGGLPGIGNNPGSGNGSPSTGTISAATIA